MSLTRLGPKIDGPGDKSEVPVADGVASQLLEIIKKELKILNLHMSVMTDNKFENRDVE